MLRGSELQPLDLLRTAESLIVGGSGASSQANLRRATSTVYYTQFHHLAKAGADLFVGATKAVRSRGAWRQTYRALEHRSAKAACADKKLLELFPQAIADYAFAFLTMQEKRHAADYDPYTRLTKSEVRSDIELVRQVIAEFDASAVKDRRAFIALVLFKKRLA